MFELTVQCLTVSGDDIEEESEKLVILEDLEQQMDQQNIDVYVKLLNFLDSFPNLTD